MRWIILCILLALPGAVLAQDDDGSRLERFIEEQLSSGENMTVDLRGFRGALSSSASLERLTVSDKSGAWLVLENATLNWTRSALLQGRLQVESLTADRLSVLRAPIAAEDQLDLPAAEATPFALPELPVSIDLGELSIAEVNLGEPLLGRAVQLSIGGSARLADGEGAVDFDVMRLDGPAGQIDLDAQYTNATRQLDLAVLVEEDEGGLVADLLGLPGAPALRFAVEGTGPITRFAADVALETDGAPRLSGQIVSTTRDDSPDQVVLVDLSGDLSPLVQSDYRPFFGDSVALVSALTLFEDGRIALDNLSLTSDALELTGSLALDSNRQPDAFALRGRIGGAGGGTVRLPVPDARVTLKALALDVGYDAARGDGFRGDFQIRDLMADDISFETVSITTEGRITETGGMVEQVLANLSAEIDGVSHSDPAILQTLGPTQRLDAGISWEAGAPIRLQDLSLIAGDLALNGGLSLDPTADMIPLGVDLSLDIGDLARFAALTGQPLSGSLSGTLSGSADLLSGASNLRLVGTGRDLRFVDGVLPELFAGDTQLDVAILRDETGITVNRLSVDNRELSLNGSGRVTSTDGAGEVQLRLANLGLFNDVVEGPARATLAVERVASGPWSIDADITAPLGTAIRVDGRMTVPDTRFDLSASGRLPLAFANPALAPNSVTGTLGFDLALVGAPDPANISGSFRSTGARLAVPGVQTALENLSLSGNLDRGRITADVTGNPSAGGSLDAEISVDVLQAGIPISALLTGRGVRLVDPTLYDARFDRIDITYAGSLSGSSAIRGTVDLGETEVRVPETGLGALAIPEIRHFGETAAERQTRMAAGLIRDAAPGGGMTPIGLDLTISAPDRVFIRGRGLDAELGGRLRVGGTTANVIPSGRFDLIRGRLSILGTRLDLTEGSATLQGSFEPFIRLLATSRAGGYTIGINVIGTISSPDITFTSDPSLPEDEVLAQLLFGRSVSSLSAVQLLQLADAAASLAGGSTDAGVFAGIRDGLGLDNLDLATDGEGGAALRAGRYISDNVYTDVTIDGSGETDLSLNIDLTENITARGSFASDGNSSIGVFFERDY